MKGRMVRSWQTPMTVRKSPTGSVSKTVSTLGHLGAERLEHLDRPLADGQHLGVDVGVAEGRGPDHTDRHVGIVQGRQPRCFRAWQ